MVYRSIEHAVPLQGGQGLVGWRARAYLPGEYSRCINFEVSPDRGLRSRRSIRRVARVSEGGSGWRRLKGKGVLTGVYADSAGKTFGTWYGRNETGAKGADQGYATNKRMGLHWDPDSVAVPPQNIYNFHQHNAKFYWVGGGKGDPNVPAVTIYSTTEGDPTAAPTVKNWTGISGYNGSFIFRDRLWVLTDIYIRWSKIGDPMSILPADGGGFYRLNDERLLGGFGHRNSVYILTTRSIYIVNYTSDPTPPPVGDGSLSLLTAEMGAHSGCVYEGVPYVVNPNGIYTLFNGYPEKVCDLDIEASPVTETYKLVPFDDTLYVIKQHSTDPASIVLNEDAVVYAFNVYSGTLAELNYREYSDEANVSDQGFIIDALNVQTGEGINEEIILWMVYCPNKDSSTIYYTTSNRRKGRNINCYDDDQGTQTEANTRYVAIKHELEIPTIVPDGNEWTYKKFRHLLIEGQVPGSAVNNLNIYLGFQEPNTFMKNYQISDQLNESYFQRQPFAYRFGINQRGRSMSIKFTMPNILDTPSGVVSITRIMVLWSYLNRAMDKHLVTDAPAP